MQLTGKKAIVTGSSSGIGACIAESFAREGADIIINYNSNKEGAESVKEKIKSLGIQCFAIQADVSSEEDAKRLIDESLNHFGHIDILVNNAGGAGKIPEGNFSEMPLEYWRKQIDLNLNSAVYCSYYVLKNMLNSKIKGKIINISSVHSLITFTKDRRTIPYPSAKAGLNMFTKSLAVEFSKKGICVNGIAPGFIVTPLTQSRYDKKQYNEFIKRIPRGRPGKTEDVAGLAVFLATDKADFITGQTIFIDGGQSIDGYLYGLGKK